MDTTPESLERRQRLELILAGYLQAVEKGHVPDERELLVLHPHLADELASFFANRAEFAKMAGPVAATPAEMPTLGTDDSANGPVVGDNLRYFGDYEILAEIARGGMGVVYKARQVSLNRVVALKMILGGQLATQLDVQRFKHEAEAAANLDHPHIVPIYEVSECNGQHYFSMKLIDAGCLSGGHERVRWDRKAAVRLVAKVARAVHYAHQRGILHRDLKPANILLDKTGEPHVTDFGLAKRVTGDSGMTQSGAIVGTPSYMAPEQAAAKKGLTTAVDVYSLGAILYELLTCGPPFKGATPLDTLLQVMDKEPARPRSIDKTIDRDLETIVLKCLAKDHTQRYASAEALADELERWLRGESIVARRSWLPVRVWRWGRRHPWPALTSAAALLALLVFGSLLLGMVGMGMAYYHEATLHTIEADRTGNNRRAAMANLRRTYFWQHTLAMRQEAIQTITLAGLEPVSQFAVDNDPTWDLQNDQPLRLGGDGTSVIVYTPSLIQERAVPSGMLLREQPNPTGKAAPISEFTNLPKEFTFLGGSRNGKWAVLASGTNVDYIRDLFLWDATAGKVVREHKNVALGYPYARVSEDGRRMAYFDRETNQYVKVYDWERGGRYLSFLPNGVGTNPSFLEQHAGFSPDGSLLAMWGRLNKTFGLVVFDVEHGEPAGILENTAISNSIWSADGRWLITLGGWMLGVTAPDKFATTNVQFSEVIYPTPTYKVGTLWGICPLHFVRDGKALIAGNTLFLVRPGEKRTTLEEKLFVVTNVPGEERKLLAAAGDDWLLETKPWRDDDVVFTLQCYVDGQHPVAFKHPGFTDEALRRGGKMPTPRVTHATLSPDGKHLLALFYLDDPDRPASAQPTNQWSLELWDREKAERLAVWNTADYGEKFTQLRFAPDGRHAVTLSTTALTVWDVATGRPVAKLRQQAPETFHTHVFGERPLRLHWYDPQGEQIAFRPDGSQFLWLHANYEAENLTVHETSTGRKVGAWTALNSTWVQGAIAVSPDGRLIAGTEVAKGVSASGFVKLLDGATGEPLALWEAGDNPLVSLEFSPDGAVLVSADSNGTVKVWSLAWIRKELAALRLDW
jgi:WD40 repeat protein/tRNA A-37 threonylcarbamoyl transferase component Bud32